MKKTIVIEGKKISSLSSFYDEIENKFTRNLGCSIGRNLDAFNDVLRGGFGVHEYEEPIKLIWLDSKENKINLGWDETIKYLSSKLKTCHPSNIESIKSDLELAKQHAGETLFELIIVIIKDHNYIELELN